MKKKRKGCKVPQTRLASNLLCLLNILQACPAENTATCICRTLPPDRYQAAQAKMKSVSRSSPA